MILSDFLSRQMIDKSNPHEIIPISFDMKAILKDRYCNVGNESSKYLVQTHSQAKSSGIKLPNVHSVEKGINPDIKPERQVLNSQNSPNKPRLGQRREGLTTEMKVPPQVQIKPENQTREQTSQSQKKAYKCP